MRSNNRFRYRNMGCFWTLFANFCIPWICYKW